MKKWGIFLFLFAFSLRALTDAPPTWICLLWTKWRNYLTCSDPVQRDHVTCCLFCLLKAVIQLTNDPVGKCFICFSPFAFNKTPHGLITHTVLDWEALSVRALDTLDSPLLFVDLSAGKLDEVKIIITCNWAAVSWYNLCSFSCHSVCFLWFTPTAQRQISQNCTSLWVEVVFLDSG